MNRARLLSMFGIAALAFALPFSAGATVKKEGSWPVVEKKVDLEFDGKPSDGLKQLAKKADWSLVITNGVAIDGADVHVDVDDVPADAVLEALFVNADVVAHRNGKLVTITPAAGAGASASDAQAPATAAAPQPPPDTAAAPPAPPPVDTAAQPPTPTAPAAPPVPTVRGEDRDVIGGRLVIHKDEIVHTVTVTGGSLKVEGIVTGDLVVMGGAAKVAKGGRVIGNATVMGGSLKIEKGGRVDGDVGVVGGSLKREKGAIIGGRVIDDRHEAKVTIRGGGEDATDGAATEGATSKRSRLSAVVHELGRSLTKMALLFVLGCVLLALAAPRMEKLRVEVASRPMRSFALGVLGAILGFVGGLVLVTILCVTIIGIPVAIAGILFVVLALYGAIASVLTTFGAAVAGHRTQNPYVHLLIGCAAFFLLSSIPWVGGIVTFVVTMIALGALVATRAGGLFDRRKA